MKKINVMSLILCSIISFSLIGCNLKDDYIIERKENTDEKPSGDKVNEAFESEKITDIMNKLKTMPKDISDKLDEGDSDTTRTIKELNDKADELTDALNNVDFEGKSEDFKKQLDDISDKLDEMKDNVEDAKNRSDTIKNSIDKVQVTDTIDEFTSHMDNLEKALNRASSTR